ncbi:ribose-phosphate pyrophosphokinase [Mesomycoplasma hyopneumoniae]|uniref:ribose-phosphate diphosphokinase n=1 Tax=Mesomycoplasma hyopneumoniae TaxID=2099 RepID=A0ABD4SXK6_MESHO|nr:ribose-phosphate pyrophosphokinase [Mesomycoplasma hyopneumoniae]MCI8283022.1 ribose-phosphate pyrophosphokinase [Mesomycoplasma hyopneumoniae]MCI8298600.1 ribose-phosphate pyrophosphokinase [Mesomycoplasma hyopneumoniae]
MNIDAKKNIILFGMENSLDLAKKISKITGIPLSGIERIVYADGEVLLKSKETIRNSTVFVVANTSRPVNENIMELLIFIDSLKRGYAQEIIVILSYYGYARQDRKSSGRQPITAKLVANLLEKAGITKLILVDIHNPSIQGFFDFSVDEIHGQYILANELVGKNKDYVVVSPDHGGAVRARILAEILGKQTNVAVIDKRRTGANKSEVLGLIGDVDGKDCIIIDDIIDTGGTIINAANVIREKGAKSVVLAATHGVFSHGFEKFQENPNIDKVIITDSIDNKKLAKKFPKLLITSLAEFLSKSILACIFSTSITSIYEENKQKLIKKNLN